MARAQTGSQANYKQHNTVQLLLEALPRGVISFISNAWGGQANDKHVTKHCGILQHLLPDDVVLEDRGFDIELVALHGAKLQIPAFTRGKTQLSAKDVHTTRTIMNVRIHVERVILHIRSNYTILHGPLRVDIFRNVVQKRCL